ncbi:MAG: FHA domain-containing protein [Deltaproteobacteria bacterium]|nr:FHA domain-containing protein [Deltaproteobacteria bacterium]
MDEQSSNQGLEGKLVGGQESGFPVRFPPGENIFASTLFQEGLLAQIDRILESGECAEGRLELETESSRLTCLIRRSVPFLAGLLEQGVYSQVPLYEFPVRARQLEGASCSLIRCELPVVMMAAVHFTRRPMLQASTRLVDPAHVLEVLAEEKRNAALAFERGGTRTLLFLNDGQPARLYFGDPKEDIGEGSLEDRMLAYAFSPTQPEGKVEVFTEFRIESDPDAGKKLSELAESAKPCPPLVVCAQLQNGREVARRAFHPPRMVIGRDAGCDLLLDNLAVSRRHAQLLWERGQLVIHDLGSANGISVNGHPVSRCEVSVGDRLELGKFEITLEETIVESLAPQTMVVPLTDVSPPGYLVGEETTIKLQKNVIIGKGAGVDVEAEGWFVKPVHARLVSHRRGKFELTCFGSARIKVNGKSTRRAELSFGDRITIGRTELVISSKPE